MEDRIVALAFLTQRDLDVLGTGLRCLFAVDNPDAFADLLTQLDLIDAPRVPDSVRHRRA